VNEFLIKILRIILVLVMFSVDKEDFIIKFNISISVIYAEAVRDSIWEEM